MKFLSHSEGHLHLPWFARLLWIGDVDQLRHFDVTDVLFDYDGLGKYERLGCSQAVEVGPL